VEVKLGSLLAGRRPEGLIANRARSPVAFSNKEINDAVASRSVGL
jgi:hypothetical protein